MNADVCRNAPGLLGAAFPWGFAVVQPLVAIALVTSITTQEYVNNRRFMSPPLNLKGTTTNIIHEGVSSNRYESRASTRIGWGDILRCCIRTPTCRLSAKEFAFEAWRDPPLDAVLMTQGTLKVAGEVTWA